MRSGRDLLKDLNDEQRFAVTHTDGPLLILAGAGSGKTRTITYKIAYLLAEGACRAENILAVTFTNKAAEEMRNRVLGLLGPAQLTPQLSTFHSFSARLLRRHASLLGYTPSFTIADEDDQKKLLKQLYAELGLRDDQLPLRKTKAVIGKAKNRGWGPEQYMAASPDLDAPIIFSVFNVYEQRLKKANAVDFDDLLLLSVRLLSEHPDVRKRYASLFRYLLIDEYQDTNLPQFEIAKHLASEHRNITAVGDEDQSIYGFRGADIKNILSFERDFPGAVVVKLEQNYRSTQNILDAATAVVSNNKKRKGKRLWTDGGRGESISLFPARGPEQEAEFVSRQIQEYLRAGEERIAVLYRVNFLSRNLEEALRRLQIPYRLVGGLSFYSRKEVKDALAYLRAARNPNDDISLARIINEPHRGLGKTTLDRLFEEARSKNQSLWEVIGAGLQENAFPGRVHQALGRFSAVMEDCVRALDLPLSQGLEAILQASGCIQALEKEETEEANERLLNLEELVNVAKEYESRNEPLQEFLDTAALYSDTDDYDEDASVLLMTLHNAKGLEFPIVFIVGCEEGLLPHSLSVEPDEIEEERRLCYVGLTRAQKKVCLTFSQRKRFQRGESEEPNQPSRFLTEIPPQLMTDLSSPALFATRPFSGTRPERTYNTVASIREFLSQKQSRSVGGLRKGALVEHERFGRGRVLAIEESGNDLKVTVQFPDLGIKKLLQSYARLRVL